ncbi:MAG: NAD(+)/NADH kinase [Candidatus Woesearchaeota archaeon]|jgi:NAD+ kinase|nr:NAD(+)/NADH kinase [Candidatus Woesearchaeota archaeon]MDP6265843.1 NAD(+)/NADH kinase [Candidatus Woesearchaeota archaeon]|tara:strand:- start:1785 stop:2576 length:792 start_codon:yes stop_codon:yes gene_type:complete
MKIKKILVVYTKLLSKEEESTLSLVKNTLKKYDVNYKISNRERLNKKLFQNKNLVIAVGGDGTFLRASHFIFDKTPIMGINSDPRYKEGFFMIAEKKDFKRKLKKILKGNYKIKKLRRLEAYMGNKKVPELALNEFYIASEKQHHTARYFLNIGGMKERQKSSGVLISTAAGSNAWVKSAGGKVLPLSSDKFEYLVREPYCGRVSAKCDLINNILDKNEKIEIEFEVGNGILIVDSLSKEYKFKARQKVTVKMSEKPLNSIKL